ncbi:hypothetical protein [Methanoculleus caldifontis]|uniref:hypothetical protein n=1 Tax=Methanoculleus caldifontis TaxID=2651577 RepID=UPI0029372A58|nr:hypothetical protein [Methanoculleus sp. Wushi-C6]
MVKNTDLMCNPLPRPRILRRVAAALPSPFLPNGGFKEIEAYQTAGIGGVARAEEHWIS